MKKVKGKLYIILICIVFGCSTNDTNEGNKPPSDFEVNVDSEIYSQVELTWSESFDPENDEVTYSVYLNDELIESNLSVRMHVFENLNPSANYGGKVVANDGNGNKTSKNFVFTTNRNLPPSDFAIVSIAPDNVSAGVIWSESVDPEGGEVLYNLYLEGSLIEEGHNSEYFQFIGLVAATSYQGKIIAIDSSGNESVLDFEIITADGIYQGDVSLNNQSSVNDFGIKGYVEITGDLQISGFASNNDVNDLSPLETIKTVKGYFDINFCDDLLSLSGLGIEHVGKSFRVRQNDKLNNLRGLENLKEVLGSLEVYQNSALEVIDGLNNLTTIGASFSVQNNTSLLRIEGFNMVNQVDSIFVYANWLLTEINGFNNVLDLEGDLTLRDNTSLITCIGFEKIKEVGRLYIENTLLQNIDMLSTLEKVYGDVSIQSNTELANIAGLTSLVDIVYGSLIINANLKLTSLNGLQNLNAIGYTLRVNYNSLLSDFCALQNVMQSFVPQSAVSIYGNQINPSITLIANGSCN